MNSGLGLGGLAGFDPAQGVAQDQAAGPLGIRRRKPAHRPAAHRLAGQDGFFHLQMIEQGDQILHKRFGARTVRNVP